MIQVQHISASYVKGKKALDDINFTLEKGTLNSLVGPSGCGKTTLLNILAGFLHPTEGKILIDGEDITHLAPQKRGTTMVFQNYALWPHMTIFDNIAYGLKLQHKSKEEIETKVRNMLDIVEIDPSIVKSRRPAELSGGQQQRVALARALVVEPKIILMDEPLSNLDAKVRQRLRIEIREIQQRLGVTAVYVTHDQEEAMSMSDQVIVMNKGVVAQHGTPQEVYARPTSPFVAEFLGHSNVIHATAGSEGLVIEGQREPISTDLLPEGPVKAGKVRIIVRSEYIYMNEKPDGDAIALNGEVIGSMYAGTFYRHLVRVGKQELFVDTSRSLHDKGPVTLYIPVNMLYIFSE